MSKLLTSLPDVQAQRVDDNGRAMKGADGKVLTKLFSGQSWNLTGSDPATNGGWQAQAAAIPAEIAPVVLKGKKAAVVLTNDEEVLDITSKID